MTAHSRASHLSLLSGKFPSWFIRTEGSGVCPQRAFFFLLGLVVFDLSADVLCSPSCRHSHAEQAESSDRAPASPPPPISEYPFLSALPPCLHDNTEFPTPPPTLPKRDTPEALSSPATSPHFPSPAPSSPSVRSSYQCEDPASTPCHLPLRYELYLSNAVPEPTY